jgi:thymidylate synthase
MFKRFIRKIYSNHIEQVTEQVIEQIKRIPYVLPHIILPDIENIDDIEHLTHKDFELFNYSFHPSIKGEMVA